MFICYLILCYFRLAEVLVGSVLSRNISLVGLSYVGAC
jgi:hypothetical protein